VIFGKAIMRIAPALLIAVAGVMHSALAAEDASSGVKFSVEAAAIFGKRCTACHTYGKGIKVGPDLKGVTERRKHDWLLKFIHSSSTVIKSGDPTATNLFAEFKQQRMPDWTDLSEKQVNDILDYLAVGGPDIKPDDERNAELAAPSEIEHGRRLFSGRDSLQYGAQACITCHSIQGLPWGGSLGPELTQTYVRYQDRALTEFLRHPCFQWRTANPAARYLTPKESFALKSFLRRMALEQATRASAQGVDSQRATNPTNGNSSVASRSPRQGEGQKP
jgi:mono/diheme cytochrome c family protein